MSSGDREWVRGVEVVAVDLVDAPRDVALEATDDFAFGHPFCDASGHVVLGGLMPAESDHDDPPERVVEFAVAAAVESMSLLTAA